jgi:murein DD-endopeptidase MepM/ murein hydrolase activator NlpD
VSRPRRLNVLIFPTDGSQPLRFHLPGWVLPTAAVTAALGFATVALVVGDYLRVRQLAASPAALERALAERRDLVAALRTRIGEIRLEVASWRALEARLWEPFGPDIGAARRTPGIGGAADDGPAETAGLRPSALEELNRLGQSVGEAGHNLRAFARLMEHAGKALALMPSRWPVRGAVNSEFGGRPSPWTKAEEFHGGLDIAADHGTAVRAPAAGTVLFAGPQRGLELSVIVEHSPDIRTVYGHLSRLLVALGDHVERGQTIGLTGTTGKSSDPYLHYEILVKGRSVNPRLYLWN